MEPKQSQAKIPSQPAVVSTSVEDPEKDEKPHALFLRCTVSGDLRRDHEDQTEKHDRNEGGDRDIRITISAHRPGKSFGDFPGRISGTLRAACFEVQIFRERRTVSGDCTRRTELYFSARVGARKDPRHKKTAAKRGGTT